MVSLHSKEALTETAAYIFLKRNHENREVVQGGASVCCVMRTQVTMLKLGFQNVSVAIMLGGQRWVDPGVLVASSLVEMTSFRFSERHRLRK